MQVKKKKGSFNDYELNMSWGELEAIRDALSQHHTGPIADELFAGIIWSMERLPKPGEDEDSKEGDGEENIQTGGSQPISAGPGAPKSPGGASGEINSLADLDRELPAPKDAAGEDEGEGDEAPPPEDDEK